MLKHRILLGICALAIGLAAPVTGRAQTVSAEAKAAAKELMIASRATDQFKILMPTLMQAMKPAIVQGRPEVEQAYNQIAKSILESFSSRLDEFVEQVGLIYARNFTVAELRAVTAFMRGPVGQKYIEKLPVISQEALALGQRFGQSAAVEMRQKMIDELRKRGHNI